MVYITGDIHGDITRFREKEYRSLGKNDTLIICGDFGFLWDNSRKEHRMLRKLAAKKYTVCFIDGTHENFDLLNAYKVTQWNGGNVHRIASNIYHLMRGQIFTIDGLTFFTFGGGESFDRATRKEHDTWWKEEMPSPEQLYEGAKNIDRAGCKVDVIVTHEPPARIKGLLRLEETVTVKTCGLNRYFEELSQICKFRRWYFGAMHYDHTIPPNHTAVFKNLIRLDEEELSPRLAVGKSLHVPAYSSSGKTYKQKVQTPDAPEKTPVSKPGDYHPVHANRPPRRAAPSTERTVQKTASAQQANTSNHAKRPLDTASDYSAAYKDITALIDSILAEEKK